MKKPKFADLADGPEHERIAMIGQKAMEGHVVGFIVDDYPKADRYIEKLTRQFPALEVEYRGVGPVPDTVLVRVRRVNRC